MHKKNLGNLGEQIAVAILKNIGHKIIATNYRIGHKEIDIISTIHQTLVFTEIKSRSNYTFGYPEEAVNAKKINHLKSAAELYCIEHPQYQQIRFDIISLLIQQEKLIEYKHFEDAFY